MLDLDTVNNASVVQSWQRGFATLGDKSGLLIVDEYTGSNESQLSNVTWALHTHATVKSLPSSNDKGFQLSSNDATANNGVLVRVIEPQDVVLGSVALQIKNDKNYPDPGLTKLMVSVLTGDAQLTARSTTQADKDSLVSKRIIVQIGQDGDNKVSKDNVRPLHEWKTAGPLVQ